MTRKIPARLCCSVHLSEGPPLFYSAGEEDRGLWNTCEGVVVNKDILICVRHSGEDPRSIGRFIVKPEVSLVTNDWDSSGRWNIFYFFFFFFRTTVSHSDLFYFCSCKNKLDFVILK